ncbi:hypothetical protein [Domibacillus aminovorans]|nr:hypothetical protein [Domibacillus aminovorans]
MLFWAADIAITGLMTIAVICTAVGTWISRGVWDRYKEDEKNNAR